MALLDAVGVASIMPFIVVLSQPDIVYDNKFLLFLYGVFKSTGYTEKESFLFF